MTDPVKRINLLEGPAFQREIAIQDADAAIQDLDTDLPRRIGGPDISQVPAQYLAHRAWARSVDVFEGAWPVAVQRAVITASPQVQARKGVPDAVERALAALNVDATVTEWFETVPRGTPYTFSVKAYARSRLYDGPLLDARLIKAVFATVLRTKPLSRAFDLTVGAKLDHSAGLAPVLVGKQIVARGVVPRPRTDAAIRVGIAPILSSAVRVSRAVRLALPAA